MSFGFLGIQFRSGPADGEHESPSIEYLGASESDIPLLWLAAPVTGLLVQPIVGYASDRTWTRTRSAEAVLPRRGDRCQPRVRCADAELPSLWVAAGLLWILDAAVNVSMEHFRAFVGDLLPRRQRQVGFAMQSLLIGLGAVLSSALPRRY
jgi:maltose/moltooligosaccharide transporter